MPQEKQKKVPAIWKVIAKLVPAEKTPRTLLEGEMFYDICFNSYSYLKKESLETTHNLLAVRVGYLYASEASSLWQYICT
jgi:hypothetical protein